MDKMSFASYKFKPSDVIDGLNRYFAETKANRYLRVPLEIRNGEVKPGNYYVLRNIVFVTMSSAPKVKESGYYYIICDPEEVIAVAINWLREEHDIFYTPPKADGFEAKIEPLSSTFYCCDSKLVTETQRLQEENKKLKEKVAEQQKKIDSYEATLGKITDVMQPEYAGPTWSETWDDLAERIKRMKEKVEALKAESTDWRESFTKAQDSRSAFCKKLKEELNVDYRYPGYFPKMEEDILAEVGRLKKEHDDVRGLSLKIEELEEELREANEELAMKDIRIEGLEKDRDQFGKRLADIRKAAGMTKGDPTDLVKYVEDLAKSRRETLDDWFGEHAKVLGLETRIFEVYREIFDCSNGDPEGSDAEVLQDILTEYQRVLKLKDVAEEKAIKYKELALENEDRARKEKDKWKRKAEDANAGWESDRWLTNRLLNEQRDFITKVANILEVKNPYIESEYAAAISKLHDTVTHPNRYKWLYEKLKDGMTSVLQEAEDKED